MMTPMKASIEILLPVSGRAKSEPSRPTGRIIMMMTGMMKDSNWLARTK